MFFITSCGTDIGKTLVTGLLCAQLRQQGRTPLALKPIISGFNDQHIQASDSGLLLSACGKPITKETINHISPWRYNAPLSPHLAAAKEHCPIDWDSLITWHHTMRRDHINAALLIEGAGGVLTPITYQHTVCDLIHTLHIPCILVTGSYLGSISHTLTAYETLHHRGINVNAIIISESSNTPSTREDVAETLRHFTHSTQKIMIVPRLILDAPLTNTHNWDKLLDNVPDLTSAIDTTS